MNNTNVTICVADGTASLDNNNEINFTTQQMEKLWTDLSQAWPAVKNNPEIAEKIEKLWDILKASGNDHLAINKEIQNLLDSNNNSSILTSSSISSIEVTPDSLHTPIQADQELDSLLAEILGENYQDELNQPAIQTDNNQNIPDSSSIDSGTEELDKLVADILGDDWLKEGSTTTDSPSSYDSQISKSQQNIDSLVSSIIGDELKEESSMLSTSNILTENKKLIDDKQDIDQLLNEILNEDYSNEKLTRENNKSEESIDILINEAFNKESEFTNTTSSLSSSKEITTKDNIDSIINEILNKETDFENTTSSLSSNKEITTDDNIDSIINETLNKETDFENTISSLSSNKEITTDDNIDSIINEVLNKETDFENTISSLSSNKEITTDDNIDSIINEILNKETDFENTAFGLSSSEEITTDEKPKENIDNLINEVLNKETDFENTAFGLSSSEEITTDEKPEENIDDLINEILKDKTDTSNISNELNIEKIHIHSNKDKSSHQADDTQNFKKVIATQTTRKTEPSSYKQSEKQSNSALIIIILIILIAGIVGAWKLFFNKENITTQIATTEIQRTVIEEEPEERYSSPTIKEYKYNIEPEYTPPAMEQSTDNTEIAYSALIEQDENDITITLNSPETAIESNDSSIFNTNEAISVIEVEPYADDTINTIESITEPTPPTETLSKNELILKNKPIIEKTKQEKPVKTIAKRKVIIHKIVKGDTLWAIAKRYVNNPYRYRELAKLSKIKNPNRIYPGNKVKIIVYIK